MALNLAIMDSKRPKIHICYLRQSIVAFKAFIHNSIFWSFFVLLFLWSQEKLPYGMREFFSLKAKFWLPVITLRGVQLNQERFFNIFPKIRVRVTFNDNQTVFLIYLCFPWKDSFNECRQADHFSPDCKHVQSEQILTR